MSNADRFATFIVDEVADTLISQFGDKISSATLDTVRSIAEVAVKKAMPFPMRLGINAIPTSERSIRLVEENIAKIVMRGVKAIDPATLSNTADISAAITNIIKVAAHRGIDTAVLSTGEEPPPSTTKSHRNNAAIAALLLGFIGAHKYYLGQRGLGAVFTLAFFCTFGLAAFVTVPIGIIDAIRLWTMSDVTFVEKYAKNWCPMTYGD